MAGLVLSALLAASRVLANAYGGTITETITHSNGPSGWPGQTYTGWYRYDAPALDGHFLTPVSLALNPNCDGLLCGQIFVPLPTGISGSFFDLNDPEYNNGLTVGSGFVTGFDFDHQGFFQAGALSATFTYGNFFIDYLCINPIDGSTTDYAMQGTLAFSAPVPVPDADSSSSSLLMAFASLTWVMLLRRRLRKA